MSSHVGPHAQSDMTYKTIHGLPGELCVWRNDALVRNYVIILAGFNILAGFIISAGFIILAGFIMGHSLGWIWWGSVHNLGMKYKMII